MTKLEWGYVVWVVVGVVFVAVPELLASLGKRVTPWPTISETAGNLERRAHWVALLLLAGLVVLTVHIVFYPWPDLVR
jgi:hypothetical protein